MAERVAHPRVLIAGPATGVGKTTVTLGLLAAFRKRGLKVQAFKVGPDFIDPAFHTFVAGRPSHNLDRWMLSRQRIVDLFQTASADADLSIIEGVMGLFDGLSPTRLTASSAEIALILGAPVILVLDASALARSASALVLGFDRFQPGVRVAGVILNRVAGEGHYDLVRRAIQRDTRSTVLGWLPESERAGLGERHLGLVPVSETPDLQAKIDTLRTLVEAHVDLNAVVRAAKSAPSLPARESLSVHPHPHPPPSRGRGEGSLPPLRGKARMGGTERIRVAVARDEAFQFYYEDSLNALSRRGLELVPFSPLRDTSLPDGTRGLLFGGGFPETFAERLAQNESLKVALRDRIGRGLPTYAECGGLMYLVERLRDKAGRDHPMVGVITGDAVMTDRLQNFGYAIGVTRRNSLLGRAGRAVRGHEFHYSRWTREGNRKWSLYQLQHVGRGGRLEGFAQGALAATYLHTHLAGQPGLAAELARRFGKNK